ncbi:glyceraldehyde-3-phosphate dehydrogenase [gut metagenome]|uniref:Glyceraldehyde-3-phosphate dehydrogenase n=1 Tax=gut metagenome TaxID=749906 RepID=J9GI69_9ZZZZ
MSDEIEYLVRVTNFIVIPRYNLNECICQSDTSLSIEDRSVSIAEEVRRNYSVFSVTENTSEFAFRSFLHCSADFCVSSRLSEVNCQVNYRYVQSRNTHRHTSQLTVQFRDNLTYSLSSTCRRRDDVARSSTTTTPVLQRWTVYSLLSCSSRVYSSHQTICDTPFVVQYLSDRSQAVSSTRSVRNELSTLNVSVFVNTANEHRSVVLRRSRHNYVLSTSFDVSLSLFLSQEETCRFNYVFSFNFVPLQVSWVTFCSYADNVTVNDELVVFNVSFDSTFELAVHSVILEHVSQVINWAEVIDTYDLNVITSLSCAEYEAADTTETVNTYFNHNFFLN